MKKIIRKWLGIDNIEAEIKKLHFKTKDEPEFKRGDKVRFYCGYYDYCEGKILSYECYYGKNEYRHNQEFRYKYAIDCENNYTATDIEEWDIEILKSDEN